MAETKTSLKNLFGFIYGALYRPFLFLILILLPLTMLWLALSSIQANLSADKEREIFDEMSEITAHSARLANPKSYYSDRIRRFSESLKYAESLKELTNPCPEQLEIFLFYKDGKRVDWPTGRAAKKKISEEYVKCLFRLEADSNAVLTKAEQRVSTAFSGNRLTSVILVKNRGVLVNLLEFGLKKYGIWLKTTLPNRQEGYLLAWLNQDKINRYELAQNACGMLQKKVGSKYVFAWLDLRSPNINRATKGLRLSKAAIELLSAVGLKAEFKLKSELFTVADTQEGIRLITSAKLDKSPTVLDYYRRFLFVLIPTMLLFFIWKTLFKFSFNLSAAWQFAMIFGLTALTGGAVLLTGIFSYQYQKRHSLINEYRQRASDTLEKLDRDYSAAFSEHLMQYEHLVKQLKTSNEAPEKILEPLRVAQKEDRIIFASYTDANGDVLFRAPEDKSASAQTALENFLGQFITKAGAHLVTTFNSSREPHNKKSKPDPSTNILDLIEQGTLAFSDKIMESLLEKRSTMQSIVFNGVETITFTDLVIGSSDIASGCLFIVHDQQKTELNYLAVKDSALSFKTGLALAAFPKKHSAKEAYYPRYSLSKNTALLKMQDLINQKRILCCKEGQIDKQQSLIVGVPGYNLKSYNLFLILPMKPILSEAGELSRFFVIGAVLAIVFICFLSLILTNTLIRPITTMARNASLLSAGAENDKSLALPPAPLGTELESISTALTDLILKLREFSQGRSIKNYLLPHKPLHVEKLVISAFQTGQGFDEKEIYSFNKIDEENVLIFFTRTPLWGIEASIALSMTNMAASLISKELNVSSPHSILKGLEEYFRINIRASIAGDFAALLLNVKTRRVAYCGCGGIKLAQILTSACTFKSFGFEAKQLDSKEFYNSSNSELTLENKDILLLISPVLAESLTKRLGIAAALLANMAEGMSSTEVLQAELKKALGDSLKEIGSLIIIEPERGGAKA